ncbi:MAG: zf-HC2 domain-containing protein [Bacteroidetes bacterium]|nr:zf-HC2 domain-containing protein [Bacteroidota bacterium]
MDCTFIRTNLFAITENQLPEPEIAMVREHLAGCVSCASLLSSFSSLTEVIEKDRQTPVNPFLAAQTLLKVEKHFGGAEHGIMFNLPRLLQPALAAAMILLAVITGFFAGMQGKNISHNKAKNDLSVMKAELFISELNDEDKTLELYK